MAKIVLKKKVNKIPEGSMADIAFLLLIFFMVMTVFVQEKAFWVDRQRWPIAEKIQKIPRNHTATVYIRKDETVLIDDILYTLADIENLRISSVMQRKLNSDINLITCFRTDRDTQYGIMSDVLRQLQNIGALKITFETQKKSE